MKYLLLYKGPPTQPDTSHAAWPDWFNRIGDALVDVGSPMQNGQSVRADGSARESAAGLNGYSIVEAPDMDAAQPCSRTTRCSRPATTTRSRSTRSRGSSYIRLGPTSLRGTYRPRPGEEVMSPSRNTTSPRASTSRGTPWTTCPSNGS
jgi:hypothetical protein